MSTFFFFLTSQPMVTKATGGLLWDGDWRGLPAPFFLPGLRPSSLHCEGMW